MVHFGLRVCRPTTLASPEHVRFSMWPLSCPHQNHLGFWSHHPDTTLTYKARENSSNDSHHIVHGHEGRFNEKMLVKHFKLHCKKTLCKYKVILFISHFNGLVVFMLEKDSPFEPCWSGIDCCISFALQHSKGILNF